MTGLAGSGLVLQDNAGDNLTISAGGAFTFPTALANGAAYAVTVLTPPGSPSQTCTVTNGSGSITGANVTNVSISCGTQSYFVGGTVTGLTGTVVLADNGGDALSLDANGAFSFATPIASGATYTVTVKTQPTSETCTVSGGSGTIGSGDVTNVVVHCGAGGHTIGGSISGLTGTVVLQDNGGDDLTLNANGTFAFATPLATSATYAVTVKTQPAGETCTVTGGTGTVGSADVGSVSVTCAANLYTLGGTVNGLAAGGSVTLRNNGTNLVQGSNGAFAFPAPLASGTSYNVSIETQPNGQQCVVSGGSGRIGSGNVTSVVVNCAANTYTVGGDVQGLLGTVVLQNNGGDNVTLSGNGTYAFPTPLAPGATYNVTVLTQPANETCTVSAHSGTMGTSNVTNVSLTCTGAPHTIGGTLSGLAANTSVVLQDAFGNNLSLNMNGTFSFMQPVPYGQQYDVSVDTQPLGQRCSVTNGTGVVTGDVTNIQVTCTPRLYAIGGTISGLNGGGSVTLLDNGTDSLVITQNGQFQFATRLAHGATYGATVGTQPNGQTCTVTSGTGTVQYTNVTSVVVTCN